MITTIIKRISAVAMLMAFFLPLSQCTYEQMNPESGKVEQVTDVTYAYAAYDAQPSYRVATYIAFLWPLAFSLAAMAWKKLSHHALAGAVEILLCIGSAYMLYVLTLFDTLRYGTYVAGGAITVYLAATLVEFAVRIRTRWTRQTLSGT